MSRMSVVLSIALAGSNVELRGCSLAGRCNEALFLLETADWSDVASNEKFVGSERRGRLVEGNVTVSTFTEAFRRTLTMTWSKHKLSACRKHPDKPSTCLYDGPLMPTKVINVTNISQL